MSLLKLCAMDEADLSVLSAHLQDAVLRVGDMTFTPHERRFAAVLNRFDWQDAGNGPGEYRRRLAALSFERVLGAQSHNLPIGDKSAALGLLAMSFEPHDLPGGNVILVFSGGSAIRLRVECIEAGLRDLGPVWRARHKPEHPDAE